MNVIIMKSAAPTHALVTAAAIRLVAATLAPSQSPSLEKRGCPDLARSKSALPMVGIVIVIVIAVAILPVPLTTIGDVALSMADTVQ